MTVVLVEMLEELKETWLCQIACIFCLWPKLWCKYWFTDILGLQIFFTNFSVLQQGVFPIMHIGFI